MGKISLKDMASFVRWRLVPVRYFGRVVRPSYWTSGPMQKPVGEVANQVESHGLAAGPDIAPADVKSLRQVFLPRLETAKTMARNHPFGNLTREEDLDADNLLMKYAFSKHILDVALDYFGGRATLGGLHVLYSYPWDGVTLKESQKWHLDYNDTRSLHWVAYLNDVETPDDGPLVCHSKETSRKIGRSLIVRRIDDRQMEKEAGGVAPHEVYGKAGASVFVDPAAIYHYGSRCKNARLAVFVTFNSDIAFNKPDPMISRNVPKITSMIQKMRPDLDHDVIQRLLKS